MDSGTGYRERYGIKHHHSRMLRLPGISPQRQSPFQVGEPQSERCSNLVFGNLPPLLENSLYSSLADEVEPDGFVPGFPPYGIRHSSGALCVAPTVLTDFAQDEHLRVEGGYQRFDPKSSATGGWKARHTAVKKSRRLFEQRKTEPTRPDIDGEKPFGIVLDHDL
jgi:hypothetical protein